CGEDEPVERLRCRWRLGVGAAERTILADDDELQLAVAEAREAGESLVDRAGYGHGVRLAAVVDDERAALVGERHGDGRRAAADSPCEDGHPVDEGERVRRGRTGAEEREVLAGV